MTLKDNLQHIFNSDYPGTDTFINKVILPVFGDDIERKSIDFADEDEYREKAAKAGLKKIVYAADITDEEYRANNIAFFDVTVDNNVNVERARVNIQQVIRSIVDHHSHILIVFHYEDVVDKSWRFSYAYKQGTIASTTSAKRYTYVFGRDFRGRTAADRFDKFKKSDHSNKALEDAFSVEALSDEFFDIYRAYYATFVEYITGEKYSDEKKLKNIMNGWNWRTKDTSDQFSTTFDRDAKATRDYIKKMFGRIVFLYFLQRKGWLYDNKGRSDAQYMKHLFDNAGAQQATFLDDVLEILFFYVLNTKPETRISEARMAHKDVTILPGWDKIPFLNGGLFEQDDIDPKKCTFPAEYFREFFNFLNSYNFTIDENDQEDAEIGIDPEMLGRIFENLLEDNKDKGAFYTPKPIVDYMCRESIIAYLQDDRYKPEGNELIRKFIETLNIDLLNEEQRIEIENKLLKVKICDPAIGSGAFPMGLVNLLSKIFIVLRTYKTIDQAKMKRYIMQQSIYGVDIEKGAVDIARLRFWLAMVVDETIPTPLPNLRFKIMQGNSLLEYYKWKDLSALCRPTNKKGEYVMDFDDYRAQLQKSIKRFYATSDHELREKILTEIRNNVRNQIFELTQSEDIGKIDPSETDQFFLWHTWFSDVFDNGGFDIVIGNPPYLKEGRVSKEIFASVKHSPYYQGKMDLWYMFACQGLDMLKPGGNLCFIATNNWVTSAGAQKLRNKITSDATILQLCDFRSYMIFESASIQTMIMQFKKDNSKDVYSFDLRNFLGTELKDISKLLNKEISEVSEYLYPSFSRSIMRDKFFTFSRNDDLFSKIVKLKGCIKLTDRDIAQGVVFPQDFLNKKGQEKLGSHHIGDGIFGLSSVELHALELSDDEMSLIKPYYTTEQVKRYFTQPSSNALWMIYTDSKFKNPSSLDSYPKIKAHLDQFKEIFTSDNKPYGLHRARNKKFFEGSKIICQRKSPNRPIFSFSDGETYLTQTFNIIKTDKVDLLFLTGLLSSKLIEFWLRNKGKMQGDNFQLDAAPLKEIPIAVPSIEIQYQIKALVENIIVKKGHHTEDIEQAIDHLVYHLYDLTYDEVLIIDPETPITREEYDNFNL